MSSELLIKLRVFVVGSCLLLLSTAAYAEKVTINFKDTDIRQVAEMVSKVSGKNFLIDPRVNGKVTVISSEPLDGNALYSTFLSILRVHGFIAVDDGNLVRILPASSAREEAPVGMVRDGDDSIEVQVIPVEHVPSLQMVPILRPLVEKDGHLAAHANSNSLIVAASRRTIAKIRRMLETLDQEAEAEIDTVPLVHASAIDIVQTLQTLVTGTAAAGSDPAARGATKLVADDRTNSVLVSGNTGFREKIRRIISQLDTPVRDNRNIHVIALQYAKAADMAPIIEKLASVKTASQSGGTKGGSADPAPSVQADEETNSLIITARPDRVKELVSVIRRLDVRRSQVLVEALIAEVSLNKQAELGIQWLGLNRDITQAVTSTTSNTDTTDDSGSITLPANLTSFATTPGSLIGLVTSSDYDFVALGRALDNDSDSNLLSTPSLLTLDNHEAEISVGQEVPFLTGSYTTTTGEATNPFQTIERENVGLTLRITPQISRGDAVILDIDQEISNVVPQSTSDLGAVDVVTSVRTIKTKVVVDNESILVLGGLIDDQVAETEQRVPLLGDIPLLGEAFKYRNATKDKRNLMIFIRPTILRDSYSNLHATRKQYDGVREIQKVKHAGGITLLPEADHPVLKPIDAQGRETVEKQAEAVEVSTDEPVWKH